MYVYHMVVGFYFNYPHKDHKIFLQELDKEHVTIDSWYVVGLEIGKKGKEHFQCASSMDDKSYFRFKERVFRKLGKLTGRSNEYGKINTVRSTEKLCQYCLKDGLYFTHNVPTDKIEKLYNQALLVKKKSCKDEWSLWDSKVNDWIDSGDIKFKHMGFQRFLETFFLWLKDHGLRWPPHKMRVLKAARRAGCIDWYDWCKEIGIRSLC